MQKIAHGRRSRQNRPGAIILIILLYGELHEDAADSHRITAIGGRIGEDGRALVPEFAAFAGVQASKFLDDAVTGGVGGVSQASSRRQSQSRLAASRRRRLLKPAPSVGR